MDFFATYSVEQFIIAYSMRAQTRVKKNTKQCLGLYQEDDSRMFSSDDLPEAEASRKYVLFVCFLTQDRGRIH